MLTALSASSPSNAHLDFPDDILISRAWRMAMYATNGSMCALNQYDAWYIIMAAAELDVQPMLALRLFDVVGTQIVTNGATLTMLAHHRHSFEIDIDSSDDEATCHLKYEGGEQHVTFTRGEAETLGLLGQENWKRAPRSFLSWRAVAFAIRQAFPEFAGIYLWEEAAPQKAINPSDGQPMTYTLPPFTGTVKDAPEETASALVPPPATNAPASEENWTSLGEWTAFVNWLRDEKDLTQDAALTLVGAESWYPTYPTMVSATEAVENALKRPAPKNGSKPAWGAAQVQATTEALELLYQRPVAELLALTDKHNLTDFMNPAEAVETIHAIAKERQLAVVAQAIKLVNGSAKGKTAFQLQTPVQTFRLASLDDFKRLLGPEMYEVFASKNALAGMKVNESRTLEPALFVQWAKGLQNSVNVTGLKPVL